MSTKFTSTQLRIVGAFYAVAYYQCILHSCVDPRHVSRLAANNNVWGPRPGIQNRVRLRVRLLAARGGLPGIMMHPIVI